MGVVEEQPKESVSPDEWDNPVPEAFGLILSIDPLVTLSARAPFVRQPLGFATSIPGLAERGRSLHFVRLIWTHESAERAAGLARDVAFAKQRFPDAEFIFLTNSEVESVFLSAVGIQNFLASSLIFTDEKKWGIVPPRAPRDIDAVYNAVLIPWKRHELAAEIAKLLLVYRRPTKENFALLRKTLPQAMFLNHAVGKGEWTLLHPEQISKWYSRCHVGLCLSREEGAMRAALEYLLCGLPIVSTASVGGRDRYFSPNYVKVVEATPQAIAAAVESVKTEKHSRKMIRDETLRLLRHDRLNFLRAAAKITAARFAGARPFTHFDPLIGLPLRLRPMNEVLGATLKG